jgi:anti-sigma28 factor (negative regulator of flagellin synthesis)
MYNHPPSVLAGPVTQTRPWWADDETAPIPLALSLRCEEATMNRPDDKLHRRLRPIRWELVNRVRQEIADGTYETPERWDVALDRLMDRLEDRDNHEDKKRE